MGRADDRVRSELAPRPQSLVGRALRRRAWIARSVRVSVPIAALALLVLAGDRCGDLAWAAWLAAGAVVASISLVLVALVADLRVRSVAARGTEILDYGVGSETVDIESDERHPFRSVHVRRVLVGDPQAARLILDGFVRRDVVAMITLVLSLGALSTTVVLGSTRCGVRHRDYVGATATFASTLRTATMSYLATHPGAGCASPAQLKADHEIDATARLEDPWGSAYVIECDGDEIVVTSPGPDRRRGTEDDIRVPRGER